MNPPTFSFRGFHCDIARGAYWRPEYFHKAIRHAAACGYTHFFPYLENMIRLPSMEKACPEVAYTAEDWRAFDVTAQESGIELAPHFNVIGHTEHICAAYPELAGPHGGRDLDVDGPETGDWVRSCLEEFCAFSQGRHFLIGGDEWQTPNHLLERHAGHIGRLWARHINLAVDFLVSQERIPLVWHDMLLHYPEALEHLSRDAVVIFWFYDADQDYPVLETFRKQGFRTLMASGCHGHLDRRRMAALQCAMGAAQHHQADGILMTSWESAPWPTQISAMTITSEGLAGTASAAESTALSAYAQWKKGMVSTAAALEALEALTRFPDCRAYLESEIRGNEKRQRCLYEKYHFPCGRLYEAIGASRLKNASEGKASAETASATDGETSSAPRRKEPLALKISEDESLGPVLRFINGAETFVIYPRYGASLQDWQIQNRPLIAHGLPPFLKTNSFGPGGYRSYTRAGGFRPIWALGAHHNPCILWQHPFQWRRLEEGPGIGVELTLSLGHCRVRYEVRVEEGRPGFSYHVEAIPLRGDLYGAWSFNLPLVVEEPERTLLHWDGVAETDEEPCWRPGVKTARLTTPAWTLDIIPERGGAAGYFVDSSRTLITPDLHGFYQAREAGQPVSATWRFSPSV